MIDSNAMEIVASKAKYIDPKNPVDDKSTRIFQEKLNNG